MAKFDNMLICTDLDGTLFKNDKTVSEENRQAMEYFKSEGGYFTFVTGRMPSFVDVATEAVRPNAPIGCINGGGLYDTQKNTYVWTLPMPDGVVDLLRTVDEEMPQVGIQVNTFHKVYFNKYNQIMRDFRERNKLPDLHCPYDEVPEAIAKIVFGAEVNEIGDLERLLRSHPKADNFDFIQSEEYLFEILPKGSGKGRAIENLCNYLNIPKEKTVAIGDFNNDIAMFRAAKVGIAVENACPEALAEADFVTVSNENHAIAKVIADLENGKFGI